MGPLLLWNLSGTSANSAVATVAAMATNGLCRSPDRDAMSEPKEIFCAKSDSSGSTMAIWPKGNHKLQARLRILAIASVSSPQSLDDSLLCIASQLSQNNLIIPEENFNPQILHLKLCRPSMQLWLPTHNLLGLIYHQK